MRELDLLLTRYLEEQYPQAAEGQKSAFRRLLSLSEPELARYLLGGTEPLESDLQDVVSRILLRSNSD